MDHRIHGVLLELGHVSTLGSARLGYIRVRHGSTTDRLRTAGDTLAGSLLNAAGVSEREAEVLALLGDHLTNAQIAGRLFISVRTVESHVSSLLRKLDVPDRRALAGLAPGVGPGFDSALRAAISSLPVPLTSFVGRAAERAALGGALTEHRLVTVVGPGGVGKTRLALAVAADLSDAYADGASYVDLVPVAEESMVGAAVAHAFGFGEQPGRTSTETVASKLADAEALVVLDNCEHVRDAVTAFVERLLASCPRARVLATSRVRLVVPYEVVFTLSGLSLEEVGERDSDAVALFVDRAAMAGWSAAHATDRRRIAAICDELDGSALAIELAAARLATLGLDGLEAGLADQLGLLAGGSRLDERHRTVRSALDWSFGLLDEKEQVALRRAAVFAAPFTRDAAAEVIGSPPLLSEEVGEALARLAEHSLLEVIAGPQGTRYRMLETIRQYGDDLLARMDEQADVRHRQLRWCLAVATELESDGELSTGFDTLADEMRAGLGWASGQPRLRAEAHELAVRLAHLAFARGMPGEAQWRYEEAARLAGDDAGAAEALHWAATVAWARSAGNDAVQLYRAASGAARRAGDPRRAAVQLVTAAELVNRAPGTLSELPASGAQQALLAEASALAFGDPHVEAGLLTVISRGDDLDPASAELTERAVELARRIGDARLESAALDQLTSTQLGRGELDSAAASVERRLELLAGRAHEVEMAWEYEDVLHMAPMVYLGVGDLDTARRYALRRADLPFLREAAHLSVPWLLITAALAGDFDEALEVAQRFRLAWEEAGRPTISGLGTSPAAAAMVHGIRGDDDARRAWLDIVTEMRRVVAPLVGQWSDVALFDAMVAMHRGEVGNALTALSNPPESLRRWYDGVWRQWYAAVWAEATVRARLPDRVDRLARARAVAAGNPVASAMVDRAEALAVGDTDALLATAVALDAAGCTYQRARTLVFAGGDARAEGEAILAAIGATPMAI